MSFRVLFRSFLSLVFFSAYPSQAMLKNLNQKLNTPRYESCIGLSCLSQGKYLSGELTEPDLQGVKVRFAPRKTVAKLLTYGLNSPKVLIDETSSQESKEKIAADLYRAKAFKENRGIEDKVVVLKKIRGEENINRFLTSVNQMSIRLANLQDESVVGPRKLDSDGERVERSLSKWNTNYNTILIASLSALNIASYVNQSFVTGHPAQWLLPLLGWELMTTGIFGTHFGYILYKSLTNNPTSWVAFLNGVEKRQKNESQDPQFLYYSIQSKTVKSLITAVHETGEDSAKLEKAVNFQTNEDHFILPVTLMRLLTVKKSHLRAQFLFQKENTGEQSLSVTVTAQKKPPRPSPPPPPQKDKTGEIEFGRGLVPGAG